MFPLLNGLFVMGSIPGSSTEKGCRSAALFARFTGVHQFCAIRRLAPTPRRWTLFKERTHALLGIVGALTLPGVVGDPISISPPATALALVVALAIGVIFGVYPASRAAHLAPIDALRSE